MKLYTAPFAPSPIRVHVFMDEKNISLPIQMVDIMDGEARRPEFREINSLGEVPVLELADGTRLTESIAICRYLESLYPENPLMGETALETARIDMWTRRMEDQIVAPIAQHGLHVIPMFADKVEQCPEYAEIQLRQFDKNWQWLDNELSDGRTYVCDDRFSVADIMGMTMLLITGFMGIGRPADCPNAARWESAMLARPSLARWMDEIPGMKEAANA